MGVRRVLGVVVALIAGLVVVSNTPVDAAAPRTARAAAPSAARAAVTAAGGYVAVAPARLLDTRLGNGAPRARVKAGGTLAVSVAGHGGVPTSGVSAVVVNVTVVTPTAGGHLIVWPAGQAQPVTSSSNFVAGSIVPALVVSALGSNGAVDLFNGSSGTTDLVVDVQGYYLGGASTAQGAFVPLTPLRLLDTRIGNGAAAQPVRDNLPISLTVAGRGGVPLHGAGTVVLNLTVVAPTSGGHAGVEGSNVNFAAGRTVSNLILAPVQTDGQVRLFAALTGSTALLADVSGYFRAGVPAQADMFGVIDAARFLDTRSVPRRTVAARSAITVKVTGANGVPSAGVSAVAVNLIATNSTAGGFVTAYAGGATRPVASNVNFTKGQTIDNLVWVPVSSSGTIELYNGSSGTLDLVGDLAGYAGAVPGPLTWSAPSNLSATQGGLTSLSCPTTTFCAAVDQAGNVVEYNGTTWSTPAMVNPFLQFNSVSCPTAGFCAATDRNGYVDTFHGTNFGFPVDLDASVALGGDGYPLLYQVSCASVTLCIAVDGINAYVYNGSTWTTHVIYINPEVNYMSGVVSCSTTNFCAVADAEGVVQFYQSGRWTTEPNAGAGLQVLSCASPTFCAAIGGGQATTWDGHSWSAPVQVGSTSASAVSLSCPSSTFCLGSNNVGDGLRYNGSTWSARQSPASSLAVSCLSATSCLATSPGPAGRVFGYNGSTWGSATSVDPTQSGLASASCPTTTFCVALDATSVLTFDGHSWTRTADVDATDYSMGSVSCPTTTFCVAVDDGGNEVTYNGHSWSAPSPLTAKALNAVSCSSPTWCMATGAVGRTFAFDGSTWTAVPIGDDANSLYASDVSCVSSTMCILIDGDGQAFRYDGAGWSGATVRDSFFGVDQSFAATHVSCVSATYCRTDNGYVYNGSDWTAGAEANTQRISCVSSSFCLGAQSPGGPYGAYASTVATFDGSGWSADSVVDSSSRSVVIDIAGNYQQAVSCATTTFCVVTDVSGNVVIGTGGA